MVRTRNYATLLITMTDQKKQGCQERRPPPVGDATSERSPDTHKVRPQQHTQAARTEQQQDKQGCGTDVYMYCSGHSTQTVLTRSVDGNVRTL
jgi:hypothetical protein